MSGPEAPLLLPGFVLEAEVWCSVHHWHFFICFDLGEQLMKVLASLNFLPLDTLWPPVWDPETLRGRCAGWEKVSNLTLYDFYSLCVCIYKYICVFIFSIEHTHIKIKGTPNCACVKHASCALVETHSSAVVCCTLEKKRCTIHFSLHEFNQ